MSAGVTTGHEDGLSLVEMMIALVIVGLVLSALASSLMTSLRSIRGQESTTQATAAINDILEEAQRVDYDEAVLCDTTATSVFGGTTFEVSDTETEELVLSSAACGAADEVLPQRTVTRDGRQYEVTTAITWQDDDGDGEGASDWDTPQDIKRIVVDVSWTADGEVRTARNMAFRAPQFLEQLVTAEVLPDGTDKFVTIRDDLDADADEGENATAFTLKAYGREKLSAVQVEWVDRNGAVESHPMVAVNSDGLEWEYHLNTNFGPFANGATMFEFDATSTSGETEVVAARGLFLYDPMTAMDPGTPIEKSFTQLQVDAATGEVCPGQTVWIDVEGAIRSDLASATWIQGPSTTDSLVSVEAPSEVALRGARFLLDLSGRTDFSTYNSTTGTYQVPNGVVQIRVAVNRIVDATTLAKESANITAQSVPSC